MYIRTTKNKRGNHPVDGDNPGFVAYVARLAVALDEVEGDDLVTLVFA
jgi:hypothetical protein